MAAAEGSSGDIKRTCMITGGASGIGFGIAQEMGKDYNLALLDINEVRTYKTRIGVGVKV